MSSMAGQSDHIDHVRTQLPYALTVAAIVAAGYGALALTGELWVAWVTNVVLLAAVFVVAWLAAGRVESSARPARPARTAPGARRSR
jgi:Na+/H+ antiporter NhaC